MRHHEAPAWACFDVHEALEDYKVQHLSWYVLLVYIIIIRIIITIITIIDVIVIIENGAFVISPHSVWYALVLLLFYASAMTDTGSKSFNCALVSTMKTYDNPEKGNYMHITIISNCVIFCIIYILIIIDIICIYAIIFVYVL